MSNWQDIFVALSAAGVGGGVLKMTELWLNRSKTKGETDQKYREELRNESASLRDQIEGLKTEIKEKEREIDDWRTKFWNLYTEYSVFKIQVANILTQNNVDASFLWKDKDEPKPE